MGTRLTADALARGIEAIARTERRPHAIDAEWEVRPAEAAWRESAAADAPGVIADALAVVLRAADVTLARHALWLALPVIPEADLARVAAALREVADPDARVLAAHHLVGRGVGVPGWLREAIEATLGEAGERASRNQAATLDVLRKAAAEPERFAPEAAFRHGVRLFDEARYFEAHDAWEDLWRPMRSGERDFFRGLINLAVAMKKGTEGNKAGRARLLQRSSGLLAAYEPSHRGLDVRRLRAEMAASADDEGRPPLRLSRFVVDGDAE